LSALGALSGQVVVPQVPFNTLLSWAWVAYTIEVDNTFELASAARGGRRFRISLSMWCNGLRLIDEGGITVDELRKGCRASCNIAGLERWGWISVGDPGGTRRAGYGTHRGVKGSTVVRPTRGGLLASRLWPSAVNQVEEQWEARFGAEVISALREALAGAATPMPWSPPEVHPSDGFRTHVAEAGPTEEERPLVALLGQLLTAITAGYEHQAKVSLPLAANVLRSIGPEAVLIRDLPARTGLSKEAIAMASGFLQRRELASSAGRAIRLTSNGLAALDGYRQRAALADKPRARSALEAVLGQQSALSRGLVPGQGCWRGEKPYLAQTQRLLANPIAALPWQPMVLHRGGWPDGS
jgi:hypothetical protein